MSILKLFPQLNARFGEKIQQLKSTQVINSAVWVLFATGGQQAIRLAGNLILTSLLLPEHFGVMAIVFAVLVSLNLLADIGLREGVINSDRIDDPQFMRTAWTLQILRTALMSGLAIAAAYPLAAMYKEPILGPVLIAIALSTMVTAFKSIALLAYDKRLEVKTQMLVTVGVQAAGLILSITWAKYSPTIWALVVGQFLAATLDLILSYALFKGHHSRLAWDKSSVSQLFSYGKWIFISSAISLIVLQGDRLLMGIFLSMSELGIYSVAATWAALATLVSGSLSGRILHPYFKQAIDTHSDFTHIHNVRKMLNAMYVSGCVLLAFFGNWMVVFLYDDRYASAGWMLQILALGQVGRALTTTLQPFMLASGDSFSQMKFSACSAVILIGLIWFGGQAAGAPGLIVAYSLSGIISHPIMVLYAKKHGFHCTKPDMSLVALSIIACFSVWFLVDAPIIKVLSGFIP